MMAEIYGKTTALPGQGRLDAHRRPVQGHARRQRHRRRRPAAGLRRARWRPSSRATAASRVAFFGDGASNQGTFLESLNLAAIWNLPGVFVAENNGYAESTSSSWSVATDDIADRAGGFGMPGVIVDGLDFFAVHEAAGEAIARARAGGGPTLLECKSPATSATSRATSRPTAADEVEPTPGANRDCLKRFRGPRDRVGQLTDARARRDRRARSARSSTRAVERGQGRAEPGADDLLTDVYVTY